MGKIKLFALIILATSIVILIIIFFKFPGLLENLQGRQNSKSTQQSTSESRIPAPDGFVASAKDFVAQKSKNTTNFVAQAISNKTKEVAKQVLGENTEAVVVSAPASSQQSIQSTGQEIIIFDLSKADKINLILKKGAGYFIQFVNVSESTCFYINDNKYEIANEKILQLEFQKSASYTLTTNICNLNFREMGSFSVDD